MLLLVGVELTRFARKTRFGETPILVLTVIASLLTNMAIGFVVTVAIYHILRKWGKDKKYLDWMVMPEDK